MFLQRSRLNRHAGQDVGSAEPLGRFFGEYNDASTPRVIQLAVKLYF
jgi:hypothetical protein